MQRLKLKQTGEEKDVGESHHLILRLTVLKDAYYISEMISSELCFTFDLSIYVHKKHHHFDF